MNQYESYGISIPSKCKDPELLSLYIQGKTYRDFFITEWIKDVRDGFILKQEMYKSLVELGDDPNNVFGGVNNNYVVMFPDYFIGLAKKQIRTYTLMLDLYYDKYFKQ